MMLDSSGSCRTHQRSVSNPSSISSSRSIDSATGVNPSLIHTRGAVHIALLVYAALIHPRGTVLVTT